MVLHTFALLRILLHMTFDLAKGYQSLILGVFIPNNYFNIF